MIDLINAVISGLASAVTGILALLPQSPFSWDVSGLSSYLATINYFVPFSAVGTMLYSYVTAVLAYYAIRWLLRLVKYIE